MARKIFISAAFAVAIMSFGGTIAAHAQTVGTAAPTDAATLSQQLDDAKATLVNLEMQAGGVPQGDDDLSGTTGVSNTVAPASPIVSPTVVVPPSTGLSEVDAASITSMLGTLTEALSELNSLIVLNPDMTPAETQAIATALSGMNGTLVAMDASIQNGTWAGGAGGAQAIAEAQPSENAQPSGGGSLAPSVAEKPKTSDATQPAATPAVAAQTAQAFSFWSYMKAHWPTIAIVVLVIAMLIVLFWPQSEEDEDEAPQSKQVSAPATVSTVSSAAAPNAAPKITVMQQHQGKKPA